jgi:hypothetical protein
VYWNKERRPVHDDDNGFIGHFLQWCPSHEHATGGLAGSTVQVDLFPHPFSPFFGRCIAPILF